MVLIVASCHHCCLLVYESNPNEKTLKNRIPGGTQGARRGRDQGERLVKSAGSYTRTLLHVHKFCLQALLCGCSIRSATLNQSTVYVYSLILIQKYSYIYVKIGKPREFDRFSLRYGWFYYHCSCALCAVSCCCCWPLLLVLLLLVVQLFKSDGKPF